MTTMQEGSQADSHLIWEVVVDHSVNVLEAWDCGIRKTIKTTIRGE